MLDHSVSLLYRPNILKRLIDGITTPSMEIAYQNLTTTTLAPSVNLINAMNE